MKDAIAEETQLLEEMKLREQQAGKPKTRELTKKEKDELLSGLRANLKELNDDYRKLPVTINTFGQKNKYIHPHHLWNRLC